MEVPTRSYNLEDITKTVFCIPFNSNDENNESQTQILPPSLYDERDISNGQVLRFQAYRAAWQKCLEKIQKVVNDLQISSVTSVVEEVNSSYRSVLTGLPYPELPIVSIMNSGFGSGLLEQIAIHLQDANGDPSLTTNMQNIVVHLHPGDFPNISTGMKSLISGFVDKEELLEGVTRKPATSLANNNISTLVAWYRTFMFISGNNIERKPNLVVILHDFEQYDPVVMQDVFHICSTQLSLLPFVFLLSLSSPLANYMNLTYPTSTLSLLRVRNFASPCGPKILQEIVLKTFFDLEFEPDIMIGPVILEFLLDYFTRHHSSVDSILTILQIAHLKHFSSDPLTVLVQTTPSIDVLSEQLSSGFVDALATRIPLEFEGSQKSRSEVILSSIEVVNSARDKFKVLSENLRLSIGILISIQSFLEKQEYKGLGWSANYDNDSFFVALLKLMNGPVTAEIKQVRIITSKLKRDELSGMLGCLNAFFSNMPLSVRSREKDARVKIVQIQKSLDDGSQVSSEFAAWIAEYLGEKLRPLEEADLWDIWYTGRSPFPAELLNPSIRASMMAGLLRPHDYAEEVVGSMTTATTADKSIRDLPDTSILFKRYLDSSKMINVYDWFESFKTVVESQREHQKDLVSQSRPSSPKKRGRPKVKAAPKPFKEEDQEKLEIEVQARFIRALHELDYLGFIKHTSRRADHLLRTVFDIDDTE